MGRVVLLQRRIPEYRVSVFSRLAERMEEAGIHFNLIYGSPTNEERLRVDEGLIEKGIKVPCYYFPFGPWQMTYLKVSDIFLDAQDLIIMPHENRFVLTYARALAGQGGRRRCAFFGHGANFQGHEENWREKAKIWVTRRVQWYFGYTGMSVDRIVEAGFPKDRTTCLNNAIDTGELVRWRESITGDEAQALRVSLGIKGGNVAVFIGSLTKDRRLEFLFQVSDEIRAHLPDFELLMIGDGVMRSYVREFAGKRPWVHWVGAKHGREKVIHVMLGKLILNPGMVGLNIIESFATAVPMVTTDCRIHSPEIVYLENGRNGIMTDNTIEAYVVHVLSLLKQSPACTFEDRLSRRTGKTGMNEASHRSISRETGYAELVAGCKKAAQVYTMEKMVENFAGGIEKALKCAKTRDDRWS